MLDQRLASVLKTTKERWQLLQERGLQTVKDLLFYFPWRYSDESERVSILDLIDGETATVQGRLQDFFSRRTQTGKLMLRAFLVDDQGNKLELIWFNQPYLQRILANGMELVVTGKVKVARSKISMMSPKHEIIKRNATLLHTGRLVPVYHSIGGLLTPKWFRDKIAALLYASDLVKDYLPEQTRIDEGLIGLAQAVKIVHFPESEADLKVARYRLGFDELFLLQLGALQRKWYWQQQAQLVHAGLSMEGNNEKLQEFLTGLPFKLTGAQLRVLDEVLDDLKKPYPMSRLVEGDVGSGKTVIAAAALYLMVVSGKQGLLMAPTEVLAKQHYLNLFKYLQKLGVTVSFLAGSLTKKEKERALEQMRLGLVDVVVGTHALIQERVEFKNLGLAIIDEQHRFGVKQREILKSFGTPHLLSLTATPIPRTLALTIYGDQDLSIIDEMPPGRQEIVTRVVPESKRADAYKWIESQVLTGRQVFIVCPMIDDSETLSVKAVKSEYERLANDVFPNLKLGLLHGKLKQAEKDGIMEKFAANELQVLVATTVIEVGIDVPNATIMLIESADRFGLAQLHQLRGRVGRGEHQSYCFLFPESQSEQTKARMEAMMTYTDGFKLAEIDLEMRGPGEVYGVRQSGIPDLQMASLTDSDLIKKARRVAETILAEDPRLTKHPLLLARLAELDREFGIDY